MLSRQPRANRSLPRPSKRRLGAGWGGASGRSEGTLFPNKFTPARRRLTKKRASKSHLDGLPNIASDFAGDLAYHVLLEAEIGGVEPGRASDVGSLDLRIEANLIGL